MNIHQHTNTKEIHSYSVGLTNSLLYFSQTHYDFACWFSQKILETFDIETQDYYSEKIVTETIFTITDEQQAVHRALWLLYMLEHDYLRQSRSTARTLACWAKSFQKEEPRAIILGLKYGIEPFGVWGEPKRKSHPMNVIIDKTLIKKRTKGRLSQEVVTLSHALVTKGLIQARGSTRRLEPELSDWLFGEKQLNMYSTSLGDMKKLLSVIQQSSALHTVETNSSGELTHLAIGPTVYLEDTGFFDVLQRIK